MAGLVEMDLGNLSKCGKLFREALEIATNSREMKLEMLCRLHINLLLSYTDRERDYCLTFEIVIEIQKPFSESFDLYLSSWIRARILLLQKTDLTKIQDICSEGIKELPSDSFQYLHITLIEAETAFLNNKNDLAIKKLKEAGQHPFCTIYKHMYCNMIFLRGTYNNGSDKETLNDLKEALKMARQLPSDLWENKIMKSLEA